MDPLRPEDFKDLVPPFKDMKPMPNEATMVQFLEERVRAAAAASDSQATRVAIVAMIVAVGNYEYLGPRRTAVMTKARKLLDEFGDPEHSWRWG